MHVQLSHSVPILTDTVGANLGEQIPRLLYVISTDF